MNNSEPNRAFFSGLLRNDRRESMFQVATSTRLMFGIDEDPDYRTEADDRTLHEMPHLTDITG